MRKMKIRKSTLFHLPKKKKRIKKKPPIHAYKSHFVKTFIEFIGGKFDDCSIGNEDGHSKYDCPNEQAKPKKINWKFRYTNNNGPKFAWVPKKR